MPPSGTASETPFSTRITWLYMTSMPLTFNNGDACDFETASHVCSLPPGVPNLLGLGTGGLGRGFAVLATAPYFSFEQSRCVIFFSVAYALAEVLIIGFRIFMSASYQSDV